VTEHQLSTLTIPLLVPRRTALLLRPVLPVVLFAGAPQRLVDLRLVYFLDAKSFAFFDGFWVRVGGEETVLLAGDVLEDVLPSKRRYFFLEEPVLFLDVFVVDHPYFLLGFFVHLQAVFVGQQEVHQTSGLAHEILDSAVHAVEDHQVILVHRPRLGAFGGSGEERRGCSGGVGETNLPGNRGDHAGVERALLRPVLAVMSGLEERVRVVLGGAGAMGGDKPGRVVVVGCLLLRHLNLYNCLETSPLSSPINQNISKQR
jgi:hypothetical protein